jgi:hypothetical protein
MLVLFYAPVPLKGELRPRILFYSKVIRCTYILCLKVLRPSSPSILVISTVGRNLIGTAVVY